MAEAEPYDYLEEKTPTKSVTLTVAPQGGACFERCHKNEVIHMAVDGSTEERIDLSGGKWIWFLVVPWNNLKTANSGTLMQNYCSPDYGNGQINSWYLEYPDGHTYVVRHAALFERRWLGNLYSHTCLLRVLGYKAD